MPEISQQQKFHEVCRLAADIINNGHSAKDWKHLAEVRRLTHRDEFSDADLQVAIGVAMHLHSLEVRSGD